ncbi:SPARC-related modular calcium-binding protein 1 isoform X1 [Esox lucius]|uniref:SPARC-related modular calcium-binding protein 1 isoform X1 n=1 Tax=Esox lucius TaxID=8010 RepID=UPI00057729A0|nr:SPARC-related modular calcium-binding protein 1 isoform X1 [Esox lucius]XP_019909559.2 SPARC-related modular calcium-binding protein 1 isoform X1 [Esox lucius]
MLVLAFTCRVLLIVLLSESIETEKSPPFLITENMWPRGCVLDCHRGQHRTVCGSNGRLYKSLCAFQRARCINTQLRRAPPSRCADTTRLKCQLAHSQALESSVHSHTAAIFVPECSPDGSFLQVQCHNQTGYCWCSTPDGKPISGTTVLNVRPDCAGEGVSSRPTTDPSKPQYAVGVTAPPFWVTILLNSDPKGNRSVKRPTVDSSLTCERERAALMPEEHHTWKEERFIPECSADGRYSPIQCHVATGYCWCVRVDTGRPLPGTSVRNQMPDCSPEKHHNNPPDRSYRERPLAGCPGARKEEFLHSLVMALQQETETSGIINPHRASDVPISGTKFPPTSPSAPPVGVEEWDVSAPGRAAAVLGWLFWQLDADGSGVLSEREARPLRVYLRRRLKPRRCAKKFAQYCDRDSDGGITLSELRACLGV